MLGQVFSKIISFFVIAYLARHLGVIQFGEYNLAFAFTALFIPLVDLGTDSLIVREVARFPEKTKGYLKSTFLLKSILSVMFLGIILVISRFSGYSENTITLIFYAGLISVIRSFTGTLSAIFRAHQTMKYEFYLLTIGKIIESLAVICVLVLDGEIVSIFKAILISSFCILALAAFFMKGRINQQHNSPNIIPLIILVKHSFPFAMTAIFVTIYFKIDTVFLSRMATENAVGLYNSAYNLLLAITLVSSSLIASVFPYISKNYYTDRELAHRIAKLATKYSIAFSLPISFFVSCFSEQILVFIYSSAYKLASVTFVIIIWVLPIMFVTGLFGHILSSIRKQSLVLYIAMLNAFINVGLNLWLIPRFDHEGAALATLATEIFGLVALTYFVNKYFLKLYSFSDTIKIIICSLSFSPILLLKINYLPVNFMLGVLMFSITFYFSKLISEEDKKVFSHILQYIKTKAN